MDIVYSVHIQAMGARTGPVGQCIASAVDLSKVKVFCDIGGSAGTLAAAIKECAPHLTVLSLDLPSLTEDVSKHPLPGVTYVAGSFFESVPEADMYTLKHILHDWSDDKCITILRNVHKAMKADGTLIILETILPDLGDISNAMAKAVDMVMLNVAGGLERSAAEWTRLLEQGGFRIEQVVDTSMRIKVQVCKKI